MKTVTVEALNALIDRFKKYTETAEQSEFVRLAMVQMMIDKTAVNEIVKNQKEARAMYRVIARVIFEDCTEYEEQSNGI